jgi:hypothetical protein
MADLRTFMSARLKVFYEEELDVPLVVFDEVIEHVLRIDRVLKQPMGHCLLVGDSGAGKTVLSKFVSWMNGLSIFQIKAHSKYSIEDFNEDLREIMRRVGVNGEKVRCADPRRSAIRASLTPPNPPPPSPPNRSPSSSTRATPCPLGSWRP